MMDRVDVLVTCGGGLVIPGIIHVLRQIPFVDRVMTVDLAEDALGRDFSDLHAQVPPGTSDEYADYLLDICTRHGIQVVLPFADEEVLALSHAIDRFREHGVAVICCGPEQTRVASDKAQLLEFLEQKGVDVPQYRLPESSGDFSSMVRELGYPGRSVVAKPRMGRGGRGVTVLSEHVDVMISRGGTTLEASWYESSLASEDFSRIILMECLEGQDYSVDCLCREGEMIGIVPRRRIASMGGPSQLGRVCTDQDVEDMVAAVVGAFSFTGNVNVQLKRRVPGGPPLVYEINPRLSGTIAASHAAGADLLGPGILLALGRKVPRIGKPRPVFMIRYLQELFRPASSEAS